MAFVFVIVIRVVIPEHSRTNMFSFDLMQENVNIVNIEGNLVFINSIS